jgi:hypothetical protein
MVDMVLEAIGAVERQGGRVEFDHRGGRVFVRVSAPKARWHWEQQEEITGYTPVKVAAAIRDAWRGAP